MRIVAAFMLALIWTTPALAGDARACRQWCGQDAGRCRIQCMQGGNASRCIDQCQAVRNRCEARCQYF